METSKAFRDSRASVAMYTETGLNQKKLDQCDRFNDGMRKFDSKSTSYHNHNQHLSNEDPWNVTGRTAITVDENLGSHQVPNGNGQDKEKLGRWTYSRVRGRENVHTRFITAYRPCKNKGLSTVWTR